MKTIVGLITLAAVLSALTIYSSTQSKKDETAADLEYVRDMDFKRYMGLWYNIASLPNAIEKNCKCPQSFDTLQNPLTVGLAQSCVIFGKNITSNSKAVASVDGYGNWTNWNGPLKADYWIINLDKVNYEWSVIGQPSRKGFWIFNRKPHMDQTLVRQLIDWGTSRGFNMRDIEISDQSCFSFDNKLTEGKAAKNLLYE